MRIQIAVVLVLAACGSTTKDGTGDGGAAASGESSSKATASGGGAGDAGGGGNAGTTAEQVLAECAARVEARRAEAVRLECGDPEDEAGCDLPEDDVERCGDVLLVMYACEERALEEIGCRCELVGGASGSGGNLDPGVESLDDCGFFGECRCEFGALYKCLGESIEDFEGCGL